MGDKRETIPIPIPFRRPWVSILAKDVIVFGFEGTDKISLLVKLADKPSVATAGSQTLVFEGKDKGVPGVRGNRDGCRFQSLGTGSIALNLCG